MADNVKVNEGSGPAIATDEVGGAQHQKVKVEFGGDGTATPVDSGTPLPVEDSAAATLLTALGALLTAIEADTGPLAGLLTTIDADTGNLSTILTRLTEIEEDTDSLAAIKTAVEVIDNAISGSEMQVDVVAALPAGTNAIGKLAANSGVDIGDVDVTSLTGGTIAHDAADSGNPVKVGARARTALPAAVAQDDRIDAISDKFGRSLGTTAPLDQRVSDSIDLTDTTTTDVIAAPGASVAIVVTDIEVVNGDTTVGTFVEIFDDSTKKWKGYAGINGGGFDHSNPDGLFVCTANKAVRAKCVTTSSETSVNISGYKVPA